MEDDEYKDAYFIINYVFNPIVIKEQTNSNPNEKEQTDTLRLTQEFNKSFLKYFRKTIEITPLSIMVDNIRNYRPLTDIQITQLDNLTSEEKIKIIKEYNNMYKSLEKLLI
jgi:uncharacterized protein YjgD (DUF1641 family)